MLNLNLENQIHFIREELAETGLSMIEKAQLRTKLDKLVEQFNALARQASALRWHVH